MQRNWKVPFREVYCDSFLGMLKQTLWCHVVVRVFPNVHDFDSDTLVDLYLDQPETLFEQLKWRLEEAQAKQA